MLMTRIEITNNGCGGVHLVAGHFDLHLAGYATVTSEMRSSEYSGNVAAFAGNHPYVAIVDLDDEYENGEIELIDVTAKIKYGSAALVDAYVPGQGEIVWNITRKSLAVGDGTTDGGIDLISAASDMVVESEVTDFPAATATKQYSAVYHKFCTQFWQYKIRINYLQLTHFCVIG